MQEMNMEKVESLQHLEAGFMILITPPPRDFTRPKGGAATLMIQQWSAGQTERVRMMKRSRWWTVAVWAGIAPALLAQSGNWYSQEEAERRLARIQEIAASSRGKIEITIIRLPAVPAETMAVTSSDTKVPLPSTIPELLAVEPMPATTALAMTACGLPAESIPVTIAGPAAGNSLAHVESPPEVHELLNSCGGSGDERSRPAESSSPVQESFGAEIPSAKTMNTDWLQQFNLALDFEQKGSYREALKLLLQLTSKAPSHPRCGECYYHMGECLTALGEYPFARRAFRQVLRYPDCARFSDALSMVN